MASCYWATQGKSFQVPVGSLGFSVTIFCIEALVIITYQTKLTIHNILSSVVAQCDQKKIAKCL